MGELYVVFHGQDRVAVGSRLDAALAAQRLAPEITRARAPSSTNSTAAWRSV